MTLRPHPSWCRRGGAGGVTQMYMACRHIKTNGLRCKSPALKGSPFCYYHAKVHTIGADPLAKYGPMQFPVPEDKAAIQLGIARIADALINGRIDRKNAGHLFYGLQIAAQLIDRKKYFYEQETVQSATQTTAGDELAPEERICQFDDDCEDCKYANGCPNFMADDDDSAEEIVRELAEAFEAAHKKR